MRISDWSSDVCSSDLEWTRSLSGVLTVGIGLEQALVTTERSTPSAIRPEVQRLVARLRSRWNTEEAIRAFADELDDATGDLVAANLILRTEEHTSELQSLMRISYAVLCLKKKKKTKEQTKD